VQLEQKEESVEEGGKRGKKKSPPLVKNETASNDRKNIGNLEKAFSSSREKDEARDEEVIQDELEKSELARFPDPFKEQGIDDGHGVVKADEVVEAVRHGNEKGLLLGELKDKGCGEQEREDDDAPEHQPLEAFLEILTGVIIKARIQIHSSSC